MSVLQYNLTGPTVKIVSLIYLICCITLQVYFHKNNNNNNNEVISGLTQIQKLVPPATVRL